MEKNTFATSAYIAVSPAEVAQYISNGMNLNECTLHSRMSERIDDHTWRGSASGYQSQLYYHVRRRDLSNLAIVEWHTGLAYDRYHQVYPMLMFDSAYFAAGAAGATYYHWISFVDPQRATP